MDKKNILKKLVYVFTFGIFANLALGANDDPVEEEKRLLVGKWLAVSTDGSEVTFTFKADGEGVWQVEEKKKKRPPMLFKGEYSITQARPFWKLDITKFDHPKLKGATFYGIIEILDKNSFRLEGSPSKPDSPEDRPAKFTDQALTFKHVQKKPVHNKPE